LKRLTKNKWFNKVIRKVYYDDSSANVKENFDKNYEKLVKLMKWLAKRYYDKEKKHILNP